MSPAHKISETTRAKARKTMKETYAYLKARGICVACAIADAVSGRVRCGDCGKENAVSQKRYWKRKSEARPDRCNICLEKPKDPNYKTCSGCREDRRIYEKLHRIEKRQAAA